MGSFKETLKQEFPRTPESFRQCVNNAVSKQRISRRKRFRFARTAIPVAACLILVSGTVMAAEFPVFTRWLADLGINAHEAEEMIVHVSDGQDSASVNGSQGGVFTDDRQNGVVEQEPLFTVTDVYFDGATLLFLAEPCAGIHELEFGDHVFINGTDNRLEYVVEIEEGSGIWQCEVTVMDENLAQENPEKLDVTVQVYMESGEKQEFTFTIESDKLGSIDTAENQHFELSYGTVEVCDVQTAPSKVSFTLKWTVYREEDFEMLRGALFFCEDSSGVRYAPNELRMNAFCSPEVRNEGTGWIEFEQGFEIQNFDSTSEYMIFIPAEGGYDEEGSYIGTETPREDMSFVIKF
ncbi:MAG: DUF4179 domain-containing protein [Lachnospiraceae bacterium]|nr:DUF4179 domain-containing protein [Lachnospiraceae bacterium]